MQSQVVVVPTASAPPAFHSYQTVARELNVSVRTIIRWVKAGQVPSPHYFGSQAQFPTTWALNVRVNGLYPPGHFTPARSVRAEVGKRVAVRRMLAKRARELPRTKKSIAGRSTKPVTKRKGKK